MQAFLLDSVDSTNERAKRLIQEGRIAQPAYILAREQTAGKGRHGRSWLSPRDAGIYLTVVDYPPNGSATPSTLFTLAAGVACTEVLREVTGVDVRLKPINDLFVANRKMGGILAESLIERGHIQCMLTGIGINIADVTHAVPDGSPVAVSLEACMPPDRYNALDPTDIVHQIVRAVRAWNDDCWNNRRERIHAAWSRLSLPGMPLPA